LGDDKMSCKKCGKNVSIHARGLCRKCYDAEDDMREKRRLWKEENANVFLKPNDILKLIIGD